MMQIEEAIQELVDEMACTNPECGLRNHRDMALAFQGWGIPDVAVFEATLKMDPHKRFDVADLAAFLRGGVTDDYAEIQAVVSAFAHYVNDQGRIWTCALDCIAAWNRDTDPDLDLENPADAYVPCHREIWDGGAWRVARPVSVLN